MKKGLLVFVFSALALMAACGGGGSSGGDPGTLSLSLTDASGSYQAVYVTIKEVQVHLGGNENSPNNWKKVDMPKSPITLNLLELVNGVRQNLGLVSLQEGHYTQMRLIIGTEAELNLNGGVAHPYANYVIDTQDPPNTYELKIPSGEKTGVKIVNGFEITGGETTELILDFDAAHSVVQAGASENWLLKPTIKVRELPECTTIAGQVTRLEGEAYVPVGGAQVSAQVFDAAAADDSAGQVTVAAATITDENGHYQMFVAPGDYNLVAYAADGRVVFSKISAGADPVEKDLELDDSAEGAGVVTGDVEITDGALEQYATLSFRKDTTDSDGPNAIEIISINVLNTYGYMVSLPAGQICTIVASSVGYETVTYPDIQVGTLQNIVISTAVPVE